MSVLIRFVFLLFLFAPLPAFAQMPSVDSACDAGANSGSYAIGDIGGGEIAFLVCDSTGVYRKWMSQAGVNVNIGNLNISGTCAGCDNISSEWQNVASSIDTVNWQCKAVGDQVFFKGKLTTVLPIISGVTIGTLPADCRPSGLLLSMVWHYYDLSALSYKPLHVTISSLGLVVILGGLGIGDSITLNQYSFSKP